MKPLLFYRIALANLEISVWWVIAAATLSGLGVALIFYYLIVMFLSKTLFYA